MNSLSSSNLSGETSSETLTLHQMKSTINHLNDQLIKLTEDLLYFKSTQDNDMSSNQRDCLITKRDIKSIKANSKSLTIIISPITLRINHTFNDLFSIKFLTNPLTITPTLKLESITIHTPLPIIKATILQIIKESNLQIAMLKYSNERLRLINEDLLMKINEEEMVNNKKMICINCNKNFYRKENKEEENSCLYHPGEIKYYSCKGCGKDEYYTCCFKCGKCLKGCKWGKHIKLN